MGVGGWVALCRISYTKNELLAFQAERKYFMIVAVVPERAAKHTSSNSVE